jgi:hypothetical protein
MRISFGIFALLATAVLIIGAACQSKSASNSTMAGDGKVIKTVKVNDLTVKLLSNADQLKQGDQEVTVVFNDASGRPVDVGALSLNFHMPAMGSMSAMNEAVSFTTTDTPGVYRGKVKISMAGEWQGQLAYEGPAGTGKTTFSVTAQ